MQRTRCLALFATGLAATVLLAASPAFACTTFIGTLKIGGDGSGSTDTTVVGKNDGGMDYCSTPSFGTIVKDHAHSGQITVTVSPGTGCDTGKLPNIGNNYVVGISGNTTALSSFPTGTYDSCGSGHGGSGAPTATLSSSFNVDNHGDAGPTAFSMPSGVNFDSTDVPSKNTWTICIFDGRSNPGPDVIGSIFQLSQT